jgi:hypothetical protein
LLSRTPRLLENSRKVQTVARHEKLDERQRRFEFGEDEDELRQLEANKRYWSKRLAMIAGERESEPQRIRKLYDVQAERIEPIGLVYLWPVTG